MHAAHEQALRWTAEQLQRHEQLVADAGKSGEEWMRHLVGEVEDLRDELATKLDRQKAEERLSESAHAAALRELSEHAKRIDTVQYNTAACALELQKQQEAMTRAATAHGQLQLRVVATSQELKELVAQERLGIEKELKALDEALGRQIETKAAAANHASERLDRRLREVAEATDSTRDAQACTLEKLAQADEAIEGAMSRYAALDRQVHTLQAQGREFEESMGSIKSSLQSEVHQLDVSMQGVHSELRSLRASRTLH